MSSEANATGESTDSSVSREVAWRTFAREYNDADLAFKGGDDERAPNYVATPTGAKINRLFAVGVLTEVERVGDGGLLRARVSDPTGAFVVYAGQYQPDAVSFFADAETPSFIAVVGKARTYEPEDSDDVYTSIRPEEVNVVDSETRDRWNVETARETLKRVDAVREYIRTGMTPETTPALHELGDVLDHYGTDEAYLNELEREARDVLTEIAGVEAGAGPQPTETAEETTPDGADPTETSEESVTDATTDAAEQKTETETETSEPQTAPSETDETEATETAAGTEAEEPTAVSETAEDFDDIEQEEVGEWEWDEEEREEVKEEFGAEFESGAEIAGDEGDGSDEEAESDVDEAPPEPSGDEEDREEDETPAEAEEEEQPETEEAQESAESVVMGIIEEENGDEGAERSTIIEKAADRGIDEDVAEDTLEDLLLEGMCYPTDGDRIKPL